MSRTAEEYAELYRGETWHQLCERLALAERQRDDADPNAPWMTEAHMLCTDHGIAHGDITDRIRALRDFVSEVVKQRDEARYHADSDVTRAIECGSTAPNKDGWRMDCEADEYELRYAAKRGFIERHPERPTWFKFTQAGKELLA